MPLRANHAREQRITDQVVVDAYTPEERAMAWHYYMEGKLRTPCTMKCIHEIDGSPFAKGEMVEVLRLASEARCMSGVQVIARFAGKQVTVPLEQLRSVASDSDAVEAVDDWRYWKSRGGEY